MIGSLGRSTRHLRILIWLLVILGLLRAATLVLHEPLIGLANNYDMIRVQGCIGVYPDRPDTIPAWSNSPLQPIPYYRFRDDIDPGCFLTSEAGFAFLALPLFRWQAGLSPEGRFSLRIIGLVKLCLLAATALAATAWLLRRGRTRLALAHAAVVALLISDPAVTVYLNTFYAEFAAVFFVYLSLLLLALNDRPEASRLALAALLALAIVFASLSKVQHLAFGLCLTAVLALVLLRSRPRPSLLPLGAAAIATVLGLGIQVLHLGAQNTVSMRQANVTNTVLMAVLPSSTDPARTSGHLGLPAECGEHAGKHWFSPGMREHHPCPALLEMSRLRIARLVVSEPLTLLHTWWGGMERNRPWLHGVFGLVAGGERERLPAYFPSVDAAVNALPLVAWALLVLLPLPVWLALWWRRSDAGNANGLAVLGLCAAYPPLQLALIVFGDGFADVAKQFHLGTALVLAFWLLIALRVGAAAVERTGTSRG